MKYNFVKSKFEEMPSLAHLETPTAQTITSTCNKYSKEYIDKNIKSRMRGNETAQEMEIIN